jgi:hypothetical protein
MPRSAMPPGASRCCPCTTHSPTTAASSPSPTTDSRRIPRWARAARVGILTAARSASTPSAAWCPTGSRTPPPIGPGCWPGGPNSPRPTSAWPAATSSTSWTSTAPPAPRPSAPWPASMPSTARGRWSGPAVAAGTITWLLPGWATSVPATWSRWTGGAAAAMYSPHPAATRLATRTSGSPAAAWTPHSPRSRLRCWSGCSIAGPTDPPQSPPSRWATGQDLAMGRRPSPRSWLGSPPPPTGSATSSCGKPPATSTTWSPPAPSTTTRSTRACSKPPNAAACSPTNPARPTAPWPLAARSVWLTPARPPTAPTRPHPCFATPASPNPWRADPGGEVRAMAAAGHPAG